MQDKVDHSKVYLLNQKVMKAYCHSCNVHITLRGLIVTATKYHLFLALVIGEKLSDA